MSEIKIAYSNILNAFSEKTIGSKVLDETKFIDTLERIVAEHNFETEFIPGQGEINTPELIPYLLCGVMLRTSNPNDYHIQMSREHPKCFGLRSVAQRQQEQSALKFDNCKIIIDTKQAYLNDPDVVNDPEETKRITESDATHILVAILYPTAPHNPYRLVSNLAGGNNAALKWSASEIKEKAKEAKAFWDKYITVAD